MRSVFVSLLLANHYLELFPIAKFVCIISISKGGWVGGWVVVVFSVDHFNRKQLRWCNCDRMCLLLFLSLCFVFCVFRQCVSEEQTFVYCAKIVVGLKLLVRSTPNRP